MEKHYKFKLAIYQISQTFIRFFSLNRELAVFVDDFFRTVGQCRRNFSSFGGNDIRMFCTLVES